jgi:ribosomal protein S6--L-glutamate ligase
MRILLLSRNPSLYSTARLVRSARARGHEVDVIDPMQMQFAAVRGLPDILHDGVRLERYDAVLPRIGASVTSYGAAVVRQLELAGNTVLNGADSIMLARDKVRSLQLLSRHGVRVPRTVSMRSLAGLEAALEIIGGCPAIVKLQNGTQGVGTMIADTEQALFALCETLGAMGQQIVLQEFIREAKGSDVRVFVVGGKVVASMRRTAPEGEFRSNIHRGARGDAVVLNKRFRLAALKAARALGLEIAGVDILAGRGEPLIVEVNCSPGLEGIEQVTHVDIAKAVIEHTERLAERNRRPQRPAQLAGNGGERQRRTA